MARPRRVVICVVGYCEIGLGHVQNQLQIAQWLTPHGVDVTFAVDEASALAAARVEQEAYRVVRTPRLGTGEHAQCVAALKPDLLINDVLNTDAGYAEGLRAACASSGCTTVRVVHFEDLGPGRCEADAVVNAIYSGAPNPCPAAAASRACTEYYGEKYFVAKDDFLELSQVSESALHDGSSPTARVKRVLLTFGGCDPSRLTVKTLREIAPLCTARGIAATVVLGMGYAGMDALREEFPWVDVQQNVARMSDVMRTADVAFASCGRTPFELSIVGVPSVTMAQNDRELTHFFPTATYGFVALGLGATAPDGAVAAAFAALLDDAPRRRALAAQLRSHGVCGGRDRVGRILLGLLGTG